MSMFVGDGVYIEIICGVFIVSYQTVWKSSTHYGCENRSLASLKHVGAPADQRFQGVHRVAPFQLLET